MQKISPFLWFNDEAEVQQAMMEMNKLDLEKLNFAFEIAL